MKLVKVHGRKSWNNGWEGRRTIDRTIEKKFRQTERKVVEQESEQTPMGFGTLDSVLAKIAVLEDKIARCKSSWDEATREQAEMNRLELIAILPLRKSYGGIFARYIHSCLCDKSGRVVRICDAITPCPGCSAGSGP